MADFTNEQFRLDGKVAIVTGAGGRGNSIGRAYAVGLANAGASVVVADLNREGAERVAGEITRREEGPPRSRSTSPTRRRSLL
jgi:Dehydrogenases with different specificities (related to short-chain alcohol dehydrogenases)